MILDKKSTKKKIFELCMKHHVEKMFAFGSVLRTDFNENFSDIDLLVEINFESPIEKGEHLMQLWSELELLFNKKVDLLTSTSITNPILRKEIDESKKLIYAA